MVPCLSNLYNELLVEAKYTFPLVSSVEHSTLAPWVFSSVMAPEPRVAYAEMLRRQRLPAPKYSVVPVASTEIVPALGML